MLNPSNLFNWDYRALASTLPKHAFSLIDGHCHINGGQAARLYREAAKLYGIGKAFSMSQLEEVDPVRSVLAEMVEFIAFPRVRGADAVFDHGIDYSRRIKEFHSHGARIAKFWCAPRIFDFCPGQFHDHLMRLNSAVRRPTVDTAADLGMKFMVHIGDPDVWFERTYTDAEHYGSKEQQYEMLEWLLETYKTPTIAAHLGGFPEDLDFLNRLLQRHDNLYLDTSAMKWIVRELSKHPTDKIVAFFSKWEDRIIFGTDIVTMDAHLNQEGEHEMAQKAASTEQAFDLYASRFWALRTLFEGNFVGASPVEDPDQAVEKGRRKDVRLRSCALPNLIDKLLAKNMLRFCGL